MNATSQAEPGLEALRDALSRVQRAVDALRDGDLGFAEQVLDDLAHDLWQLIELEEHSA